MDERKILHKLNRNVYFKKSNVIITRIMRENPVCPGSEI